MRLQARTHPTGPVLNFPVELLLRAQGVKLAIFDVDGVLTDGGLFLEVGGDGATAAENLKRFHTLDGYGIQQLGHEGIACVVITGRRSPVLQARLKALGVQQIHVGIDNKLTCAESVLSAAGLNWDQVAAIGDDWPDLPVLTRAALSCAPPGGHPEVLARVDHVTRAGAGAGAAREFCDLLLVARGRYVRLLERALG